MGRQCYVCFSPHRQEYEEMKLQQKRTLKEIANYARSQYGEEFSTAALSRHLTEHCEKYIQVAVESNRNREKVIKSEITKDMEAAQLLTKNLRLCADMIGSLSLKFQETGEYDPETEKSLRYWLAETRQTIELALKFYDRVQETKREPEDIMPKIEKALVILPEEWQSKFLEALEKQ